MTTKDILQFGEYLSFMNDRLDQLLTAWYRHAGRSSYDVTSTRIIAVTVDQIEFEFDDHGYESDDFPIRFFTGEWDAGMQAAFAEYCEWRRLEAERLAREASDRYAAQRRAERQKQYELLKQEFEGADTP